MDKEEIANKCLFLPKYLPLKFEEQTGQIFVDPALQGYYKTSDYPSFDTGK